MPAWCCISSSAPRGILILYGVAMVFTWYKRVTAAAAARENSGHTCDCATDVQSYHDSNRLD